MSLSNKFTMRQLTPRRLASLAVAVAVAWTVVHVFQQRFGIEGRGHASQTSFQEGVSGGLPCKHLSGATDTVVIMKTGATELAHKFPVHMRTTLRCYPDYVIFSDHEENYEGEHIRDALDSVDPHIRETHPDFDLYRRLKDTGRAALAPSELSGSTSKPDGGIGKSDRKGWKLDKWKFLPMLNHTFHLYPEKRWYTFVETDTYLFWATMLKFQSQLEHTKQYYMGAQIWIGDVEFAHGGSGFLVSNSAMRALVEYYQKTQQEWESFTDGHWAGDCVLGKAFKDSGTPLTRTWPIIQGDHPGVLPYGRMDNGNDAALWCYPITTYHHLASDVVESLWHFEQRWMSGLVPSNGDDFIRNRDVFIHWIMPQMQSPKAAWDNACKTLQEGAVDMQACRDVCESNAECLQYRFDGKQKQCFTSTDPMLGESHPEQQMISEWMFDRIEAWKNARPECSSALWIT